jgi:hypothetical protein
MRLVEVKAIVAIPEGTNACDLLFSDPNRNQDVLVIDWDEERLSVVKEADMMAGPEVTGYIGDPQLPFEEVENGE